jgi:HEAT repeat protein
LKSQEVAFMNAFFTRLAPALAILTSLLVAAAIHAGPSPVPSQQVPEVRKLLQDRSPKVRLRAAKALAEAKDADSIPVLIDLLAELPLDERQSVENFLKDLAGEWAPILKFATDDDVSRGVRRDAWASWWRRCDGPFVLATLAKHTLTADKRRRLEELLTQLGSEDFADRESATRHLLLFGRLALPRLRVAAKDGDVEVARRAKMLIERLETGPEMRLPVAAFRLLAVRKPAGAVEALLAYLPFADDEDREQEVRKSLLVLAQRDGQPDPALRRGLADEQPKVRALAAEALIAVGGAEGRAAVRKLLVGDVPSVRMRTALALARAGEREGVAVLIDVLSLISPEECHQAEDALYQLAGDTAPVVPEGSSGDDNKKRREAWSAWWKVNANRVDLVRIKEHGMLGYTLICEMTSNRLYEIDRDGNRRWAIENVPGPIDAVVLPSNRVLIAEHNAHRVTERDFQGKILWQKEVDTPFKVQRLPNGHTFIASQNGPSVELNRDRREIYAISTVPGGIPPGVLAACRSRQGNIVRVTSQNKQLCEVVDTTGKQLRSFPLKYPIEFLGCLDEMPDGRVLIAANTVGKVMEYDSKGKLVREWNVPSVATATGLPNGHILAATESPARVVEMDRSGNVVWEQKNCQARRARRR